MRKMRRAAMELKGRLDFFYVKENTRLKILQNILNFQMFIKQ